MAETAYVTGFGAYADGENTPILFVTGFGAYAEMYAPVQTHGLKAAGNVSVDFGSLTGISAQTASLQSTVNTIEVTSFAAGGTMYIAGLTTWRVTIGGATWTPEIDAVLSMRNTGYSTLALTVDTALYYWAEAFVSDYVIDLAPADAITYSATFVCVGAPQGD